VLRFGLHNPQFQRVKEFIRMRSIILLLALLATTAQAQPLRQAQAIQFTVKVGLMPIKPVPPDKLWESVEPIYDAVVVIADEKGILGIETTNKDGLAYLPRIPVGRFSVSVGVRERRVEKFTFPKSADNKLLVALGRRVTNI